jgi:hypothetical protein
MPDTKNSFHARLDWSLSGNINKAPKPSVNGDNTNKVIYMNVEPGTNIVLDASASTDPNGNSLSYRWFRYGEADNYPGSVTINNSTSSVASFTVPSNAGNNWVHVVLEVKDNGSQSLVAYKRIIAGRGAADPFGPIPLTFVTQSLPQGTPSNAYNAQLQASGGTVPYTFSIVSGSLPAGLSLSSSGSITGTPTAEGVSTVTFSVTDGASASVQRQIPITITVISEVTGTYFGTAPWTNCLTCTFDKAFDNDLNTYFDANDANGAYTGVEATSAKVIGKIEFYPRPGNANRMQGGKFQGSNTSRTTGYVDLYTIQSIPEVSWQTISVSDPTPYRYLRYLAPDGGHGNVTEVKFFTSGGSTANFTVDPPALNFGSAVGSSNVNVTSNLTWTVSDDQTWINTNTSGGSNNGIVGVSVLVNDGPARTGTVTITGGSITRMVTVSQTAPSTGATIINFTGLASSGYPGTNIATQNVWTPSISGYIFRTSSSNGLTITTWGSSPANNGLYKQDWGSSVIDMEAANGSLFTISSLKARLGWGSAHHLTITGYNAANAVVLTQSWTNQPLATTTLNVTNSSTQVKRLVFSFPGSPAGPAVLDDITVTSVGGGGGGFATVSGETADDKTVSVYPNPVNKNTMTVIIHSNRKTEANISMLSSTSKQVIDLQKTLEKGNNNIQIPIEHVRNGLYLLIINKGYERIARNVIIDK